MAANLIVITGATASGKSDLALALAHAFGGEIVNADSVQFYRGFDIGSAKPSPAALQEAPHHLYSVLDPSEAMDAGLFCQLAGGAIDAISARAAQPLIVGGSGLYIRSLLCGLVESGEVSDTARTVVSERIGRSAGRGLSRPEIAHNLHEWLSEIDPVSAAQIHRSHYSRITRALLVFLSSGRSLATLQEAHAHRGPSSRALIFVMAPDREELYRSIDLRVDSMLAQGLLEETRGLHERYGGTARALNAIGYRQAVQHLEGTIDYDRMVELIKRDTRRFAKRQLTWWRNQPRLLEWEEVKLPPGDDGHQLMDRIAGLAKYFIDKSEAATLQSVTEGDVSVVQVNQQFRD